jgi:hypothetical protein
MPEKPSQQIETGRIEALKGADELARYRSDFMKTVSSFKADIETASSILKSDEAKTFLSGSVEDINRYLRDIAERGAEMQRQHAVEQKAGVADFQTLDQLGGSLATELAELRAGSVDFARLEAQSGEVDEAENRAGKLDTQVDLSNAANSITDIRAIGTSLEQVISRMPQSEVTSSLRQKMTGRIDALKKTLDVKEQDVNAFLKDKARVDEFNKAADAYDAAAREYEKNPVRENLLKLRTLGAAIDPGAMGSEIFDAVLGHNEEKTLKTNLYQGLWSGEFSEARGKFEGAKARAESNESEQTSKLAEKMLSDVESNEKSLLDPKWREYEPLSRLTVVEDNRKADFLGLEESLLNGYLVLKATVNGFGLGETANKLAGDMREKVSGKTVEIGSKIRQIEVNRQTRISREHLFNARNLSAYVDFLGEEKDGRIYRFNAAFDQLPADKKAEIRAAVETVTARDKGAIQKQTGESELQLARSSGNFEQIERAIGEKSKDYVNGLRLMMEGKLNGAVAAFTTFLEAAKSFSPEERTKFGGVITDAVEKISLMEKSRDYFDALNKLKANDPDAAAESLQKYLAGVKDMGPDGERIHAEQIGNAREILKMAGNQKIRLLQDLLTDVRKWKEFKIKEQVDKRGVAHEVGVAGPEVALIEGQISALQERVNKGEIVNFTEEFAKIKAQVKGFLEQKAMNPKDNVIDKLAELYESLSGKDPEVRRKALVAFAQECRDSKGYDLARKYLDRALGKEYERTAREVSRESVMRRMMDDPKIMADIRAQAEAMLARFKGDNPGMAGVMTPEKAMQLVFEQKLGQQYSRELRRQMTDRGMAAGNDALSLYNDWSPYEAKGHWYEFGKSYTAEDWDAWKSDAYEFAAMTAATLPIGLAAGAIGRGAGSLALRQVGGALLREGAEVGIRDAALSTIERGGLLALRPGSAAFRALEPSVQEFIMQNQSRLALAGAARLAGGVVVEGAALYGGNIVSEGLVAGRAAEVAWDHIAESVIKAGVFRGIGLGGHNIFGRAMQAGGAKSVGAVAGMEAFSGAMGTTVEAASLYLSGESDQVDSAFVLKSLLQNALTSAATHVGEGVVRLPEAAAGAEKLKGRMEEAGARHEEEAGAGREVEARQRVEAKRKAMQYEPTQAALPYEQTQTGMPFLRKPTPFETAQTEFMSVAGRTGEPAARGAGEAVKAPEGEFADTHGSAGNAAARGVAGETLRPTEGRPTGSAEGDFTAVEGRGRGAAGRDKSGISFNWSAESEHTFVGTEGKGAPEAIAARAAETAQEVHIRDFEQAKLPTGRVLELMEAGRIQTTPDVLIRVMEATPSNHRDRVLMIEKIIGFVTSGKIPNTPEMISRIVDAAPPGTGCEILLELNLSPEQQARLIDKIAYDVEGGNGGPKIDDLLDLVGWGGIDAMQVPVVEKLLTYEAGAVYLKKELLEGQYRNNPEAARRIVDLLASDPRAIGLLEIALAEGEIPQELAPSVARQKEAFADADSYNDAVTEISGNALLLAFGKAKKFPDMPLSKVLDQLSITNPRGAAELARIAHGLGPDFSFKDFLSQIENVYNVSNENPRTTRQILRLQQNMELIAGQRMKQEFQSAFSGKESPLSPVLARLLARDPQAYEALRQNYRDLSPRYVEEIISGRAHVLMDDRTGKRIVFYENDSNPAGSGGFSDVLFIKMLDTDTGKLVDAVVKRPNDRAHEVFRNDVKGAFEATGFNNPNINRALFGNESMAIMETGKNARSFREFSGTAPLSQVIDMTRQIVSVLQTYRDNGRYHGDIKPDNMLVVDGPNGPALMVLDNTPRTPAEFARMLDHKSITGTMGYTPLANMWDFARIGKVDRGVAHQALDAYALGVMYGHKADSYSESAKEMPKADRMEMEGIIHQRAAGEMPGELLDRLEAIEKSLRNLDNPGMYAPDFYEGIDVELEKLAADMKKFEEEGPVLPAEKPRISNNDPTKIEAFPPLSNRPTGGPGGLTIRPGRPAGGANRPASEPN